MRSYFLRRLCLMPVTLIGMTLLLFSITRFMPGGPLDIRVAQELEAAQSRNPSPIVSLSEEQMQSLRIYYGLDQPLPKAYGQWLWALLQGDLGSSLRYQEPVWTMMRERLPVSLMFGFASLLCSYGFCMVLGLISAYRPRHILVRMMQGLLLFFHAIPTSIMAMLLFFLVATHGWLPLGGLTSDSFPEMTPFEKIIDLLQHATLPLLAYCCHQLAVLTFILKDSLLEQLQNEAVQMARAKGASALQALLRHALPLAILPVISQIGHQLSLIFAGSFLIERIFNLNGFGLLSFEALTQRDYPLVIGILTILGLLHIVGNLLSDLCLSLADPRIRWTKDAR